MSGRRQPREGTGDVHAVVLPIPDSLYTGRPVPGGDLPVGPSRCSVALGSVALATLRISVSDEEPRPSDVRLSKSGVGGIVRSPLTDVATPCRRFRRRSRG
jgi:hypothetical protein